MARWRAKAFVGVVVLVVTGLGLWEFERRPVLPISWDWRTGRFAWEAGKVRLPRGYLYTMDVGAYATPRGSLLGTSNSWVAVTFPDSGIANFYVERGDREAIQVLEALARSFRPMGQVRRDWRGQCGL